MKYITGALVLLALFADQGNAIRINAKAKFTDDLVKSLAEEMQKDIEEPAKVEEAKPAKKTAPAAKKNASNSTAKAGKKAPVKKAALVQKKKKAEEEDIPMDAAAIKAYSSVIADAAEDSEPSVPVQYSQVEAGEEAHVETGHREVLGADPIGSMVQNEITSIKMASIKATED